MYPLHFTHKCNNNILFIAMLASKLIFIIHYSDIMCKARLPNITQHDITCIINSIRNTVDNIKCKGVVIGISGGVDSAVVTKLCAEAVGHKNVLDIFMPSNISTDMDYKTTVDLCEQYGTEYKVINIKPAVDTFVSDILHDRNTPLEYGNISARCRMIVLYNIARKLNYIVMGTSNKSELMMGYFTKFGDGACDIAPLANLYKSEVIQIARFIGIPKQIISKPPSAGLWDGQTDESDMGIAYSDLDIVLYELEHNKSSHQIAIDTGISIDKVMSVYNRVNLMSHKRFPPICFQR